MFNKGDILLYINNHHQDIISEIFKYITYMGDGFFIVVVIVLTAVFWRIDHGIILAITLILNSGVTQFLKRFIFNEISRPTKYFYGQEELIVPEGIKAHTDFSFPSGHTAAAFSLYFIFAYFLKKAEWQVACFLVAVLVGWSRIILMQHFFIDTVAGSAIGVGLPVITIYLIKKYLKPQEKPALQKPLLRLNR